jgi:hypothetical protein
LHVISPNPYLPNNIRLRQIHPKLFQIFRIPLFFDIIEYGEFDYNNLGANPGAHGQSWDQAKRLKCGWDTNFLLQVLAGE